MSGCEKLCEKGQSLVKYNTFILYYEHLFINSLSLIPTLTQVLALSLQRYLTSISLAPPFLALALNQRFQMKIGYNYQYPHTT